MMSEEQIALYMNNGFAYGGVVLSPAETDELRAEVMRVIEHHGSLERKPVSLANLSGNLNAPVWQIVNIWEASEPFARLIRHSSITEAAAELTGASQLRIWHDQIQYKPALTGGVNMWHQDAPYWPVLAPDTAQITAWVALDDVDLSNGCMSMIPGSHLWGDQIEYLHTVKRFERLPCEFEGHSVAPTPCPVPRGGVHFHHALTWHGSNTNTTGRPRRAIALHFMTEETRYRASGEHLMKPFIQVPDGAMLEGERFPIVWQRI